MNRREPEAGDLPAGLAKPALRALASAGLTSLAQVSQRSEAELKGLHGIGPNAIRRLRRALEANGMTFAE